MCLCQQVCEPCTRVFFFDCTSLLEFDSVSVPSPLQKYHLPHSNVWVGRVCLQWVPNLKRSYMVATPDRARVVMYANIKLPVVSNRDAVIYGFGVDALEEHGAFVICGQSIESLEGLSFMAPNRREDALEYPPVCLSCCSFPVFLHVYFVCMYVCMCACMYVVMACMCVCARMHFYDSRAMSCYGLCDVLLCQVGKGDVRMSFNMGGFLLSPLGPDKCYLSMLADFDPHLRWILLVA